MTQQQILNKLYRNGPLEFGIGEFEMEGVTLTQLKPLVQAKYVRIREKERHDEYSITRSGIRILTELKNK